MQQPDPSIATLSFFHFDGAAHRFWALRQMAMAHASLRRIPELRFYKLLGTGGRGGYSIVPDFGTYAIFGLWDIEEPGRIIYGRPPFTDYLQRAGHQLTFYLQPAVWKGSWGGFDDVQTGGKLSKAAPVAVLTRARIRWGFLPRFWRITPAVARQHEKAEGVLFTRGIGEYPLFEQATFSLWRDGQRMQSFAYAEGAHRKAMELTRRKRGFAEELFARFSVLGYSGQWKDGEDWSDILSRVEV